jgi:hypothetical protein
MFTAPTQGLEHIIFDNTGTPKAASMFNLNIKAISKLIANCLKFDSPLAALAICEPKEPINTFPDNPTDPSNLAKTKKWQRKYNHAHNQQKWWDENTQKIYNLVMQHSTRKITHGQTNVSTKLIGNIWIWRWKTNLTCTKFGDPNRTPVSVAPECR